MSLIQGCVFLLGKADEHKRASTSAAMDKSYRESESRNLLYAQVCDCAHKTRSA